MPPRWLRALVSTLRRARTKHICALILSLQRRRIDCARDIVRVIASFILPSGSVLPSTQWKESRGRINVLKQGLYHQIENNRAALSLDRISKWVHFNGLVMQPNGCFIRTTDIDEVYRTIYCHYGEIMLDHITCYGYQVIMHDNYATHVNSLQLLTD